MITATADEIELCRELFKFQEDPIGFMTKVLDVEPEHVWDKMEEVALSVMTNQRTAVKAGHSVSKSFNAARIALWFLLCFVPATVVTTAPTRTQVEDILWREIRQAHENAKIPIGGNVTQTKIDFQKETGLKWFATGFSTRPDKVTSQATAFQGYHNKNILVIIDEAAGVLKEIWQAADSLLASGHARLLVIGNPTAAKGEFVNCFKGKGSAAWNHITVSVKDTPNYKGTKVIPGLSGREYEERIIEKFGEQSNEYKARVLGEIPDEDVRTLIPVTAYENAFKRVQADPAKRKFISVDPADGGDETVCYYMEDTDIKAAEYYVLKGTMVTASTIWVMGQKYGTKNFAVDCIGVGKGVADRLREMGGKVIYVNSAEKSIEDPKLYYNTRAEMWSTAAEKFRNGDIFLTHHDDVLQEQLTFVYKTFSAGRILIAAKKDIRKELGRSPDRADAYVIGLFALPQIPVISKKPKDRFSKMFNETKRKGSRVR